MTAVQVPLLQRQLARFTDWQRPSWVSMTNRECRFWVAEGLLETRHIPSYRGVVWEYRLTDAGANLAGADKPPSQSSLENRPSGHGGPSE